MMAAMMTNMRRSIAVFLTCAVLSAGGPAAAQAPPGQEIRHQEAIQAYLDADRASPPPREGILFIGSSIFRQWTNVAEHMAPLPAFNRAFGGSRTWEVLHYMDKVVLPYRPRVIVYYCGSNDVNANEPASAIVRRFEQFVSRVEAALPGTRIIFVSVNKAPQKRDRWDVVEAINRDVKAIADRSATVDYVDVNPVLFNGQGEPRMELYRPDGLHFHPPAYDEFARILRPAVEHAWHAVTR
jgi:hypothetical protein